MAISATLDQSGLVRDSGTNDLGSLIEDWPASQDAAIAVVSSTDRLASAGDLERTGTIASLSKIMTTFAALIATEDGSLDLDEPAGPPGSTVRHLLAHASGLAFDEANSIAQPGTRRIYSNVGIERVAELIEQRTAFAMSDYLREAVFEPLAMTSSSLAGSPATDVVSSVNDLALLARELLAPTLLATATLNEATSPQFPELRGVLPGFGSFDPNVWGLGFELKGNKAPHWLAPDLPPATFGHFGVSGAYIWVDASHDLACVAMSAVPFGEWATTAWPATNQAILDRYGTR